MKQNGSRYRLLPDTMWLMEDLVIPVNRDHRPHSARRMLYSKPTSSESVRKRTNIAIL
jgi:hypothetical protein